MMQPGGLGPSPQMMRGGMNRPMMRPQGRMMMGGGPMMGQKAPIPPGPATMGQGTMGQGPRPEAMGQLMGQQAPNMNDMMGQQQQTLVGANRNMQAQPMEKPGVGPSPDMMQRMQQMRKPMMGY